MGEGAGPMKGRKGAMPMTHDDADDASLPDVVLRRRALNETRAVLTKASELFRPFSCPSTAECCQLTKTGRPPWLWPSEWALLEDRLRRDGRALPTPRDDGGCPFLDPAGTRCTVYKDRPFGCRTFFCHRIRGPSAQPTLATDALLSRLERANRGWNETAAPRPLPDWHRDTSP